METTKELFAQKVAEHINYKNAEEIAAAYLALGITASEDAHEVAQEIKEAYQGEYKDNADFVRQLLEGVGAMPKDFPIYIHIDWERTARDLMMDYSEQDGHYFRNL